MDTEYQTNCCERLKDEVAEGALVCIMTNRPFTPEVTEPTCYLMSDQGHGGIVSIKFCPWCGERIVITPKP